MIVMDRNYKNDFKTIRCISTILNLFDIFSVLLNHVFIDLQLSLKLENFHFFVWTTQFELFNLVSNLISCPLFFLDLMLLSLQHYILFFLQLSTIFQFRHPSFLSQSRWRPKLLQSWDLTYLSGVRIKVTFVLWAFKIAILIVFRMVLTFIRRVRRPELASRQSTPFTSLSSRLLGRNAIVSHYSKAELLCLIKLSDLI